MSCEAAGCNRCESLQLPCHYSHNYSIGTPSPSYLDHLATAPKSSPGDAPAKNGYTLKPAATPRIPFEAPAGFSRYQEIHDEARLPRLDYGGKLYESIVLGKLGDAFARAAALTPDAEPVRPKLDGADDWKPTRKYALTDLPSASILPPDEAVVAPINFWSRLPACLLTSALTSREYLPVLQAQPLHVKSLGPSQASPPEGVSVRSIPEPVVKSCLAGWMSLCPFGFLISPSLFMEDYTAGTIDPALLFVVVGGALARRRIDAAEHNLPYQHPPNTPSSEELFDMAEKTLWTRSVRYLGDKVLSTIQALVLLGALDYFLLRQKPLKHTWNIAMVAYALIRHALSSRLESRKPWMARPVQTKSDVELELLINAAWAFDLCAPLPRLSKCAQASAGSSWIVITRRKGRLSRVVLTEGLPPPIYDSSTEFAPNERSALLTARFASLCEAARVLDVVGRLEVEDRQLFSPLGVRPSARTAIALISDPHWNTLSAWHTLSARHLFDYARSLRETAADQSQTLAATHRFLATTYGLLALYRLTPVAFTKVRFTPTAIVIALNALTLLCDSATSSLLARRLLKRALPDLTNLCNDIQTSGMADPALAGLVSSQTARSTFIRLQWLAAEESIANEARPPVQPFIPPPAPISSTSWSQGAKRTVSSLERWADIGGGSSTMSMSGSSGSGSSIPMAQASSSSSGGSGTMMTGSEDCVTAVPTELAKSK